MEDGLDVGPGRKHAAVYDLGAAAQRRIVEGMLGERRSRHLLEHHVTLLDEQMAGLAGDARGQMVVGEIADAEVREQAVARGELHARLLLARH